MDGRLAGELVDREQPVVADVRDGEPDDVDVREEREPRRAARAGLPGDEVADGVALDVGDAVEGVAHDVVGEVLVAGGAVGTEQRVEQRRHGHRPSMTTATGRAQRGRLRVLCGWRPSRAEGGCRVGVGLGAEESRRP